MRTCRAFRDRNVLTHVQTCFADVHVCAVAGLLRDYRCDAVRSTRGTGEQLPLPYPTCGLLTGNLFAAFCHLLFHPFQYSRNEHLSRRMVAMMTPTIVSIVGVITSVITMMPFTIFVTSPF